jgi:hypothetical protein
MTHEDQKKRVIKKKLQSLVNTIRSSLLIQGGECDDCQEIKPDVHRTLCPYAYEINEEKITIYVCDDCYTQRQEDI